MLVSLSVALALWPLLGGCPQAGAPIDGQDEVQVDGQDDGIDDGQNDIPDDGQDDGMDDTPGDNGDQLSDGGLPIGNIFGNEVMVEGDFSQSDNGDSRRRDERFTASFTLTPTSVEEAQAFLGDELISYYFGDLSGQAHLTYEESGADIVAELDCPTTTYSGSVEWDVDVVGSYEYTPPLGTIRIQASATNVSSPDYIVTFTTPGCPEFDNMSPSRYTWQGPGQGVWGFVTIVLENGHYENFFENPLGGDLGEQDYYEIEVNSASVP